MCRYLVYSQTDIFVHESPLKLDSHVRYNHEGLRVQYKFATSGMLTSLPKVIWRRGDVAHVRRKVAIGYNGAPQIRPQNTPSRGPIPKSQYVPQPWTRSTYDAKQHQDPIRRFSTVHWTDRPTHERTDGQIVYEKVLMTIARYASNESDAA